MVGTKRPTVASNLKVKCYEEEALNNLDTKINCDNDDFKANLVHC